MASKTLQPYICLEKKCLQSPSDCSARSLFLSSSDHPVGEHGASSTGTATRAPGQRRAWCLQVANAALVFTGKAEAFSLLRVQFQKCFLEHPKSSPKSLPVTWLSGASNGLLP